MLVDDAGEAMQPHWCNEAGEFSFEPLLFVYEFLFSLVFPKELYGLHRRP